MRIAEWKFRRGKCKIDLTVALADPSGIFPRACKADFLDNEWVIEDLTQ